jgi:hypothetical protein
VSHAILSHLYGPEWLPIFEWPNTVSFGKLVLETLCISDYRISGQGGTYRIAAGL